MYTRTAVAVTPARRGRARSPAARPRRDGREERWLLTEQNRFVNSTMKMVRGRIEEAYRERFAELRRAEGANVCNAKNREAIGKLLR